MGEIDPRKVPTADLLHVWCMPSTANVGQQEMPRPLENVSPLHWPSYSAFLFVMEPVL